MAGVGAVALVVAGGAIILGLGAADPPVAGPVIWEDTALAWAAGPVLTLEPGAGRWLIGPPEAALPGEAFTLGVRARLSADSDPGAAWGVWLEAADGTRVIYAISGEGYVTTRRCPAGDLPEVAIEACPAVRPEWRWTDYPRLHAPGEVNEIVLHLERAGVRLRLNRERMGVSPVERTGRWGVWARGGRETGAALEWLSAAVRG